LLESDRANDKRFHRSEDFGRRTPAYPPLYSEIRDAGPPGRIYARAEAVMVWIDLKEGKSRPLPEWVRAFLV
jgi:hypothetical protein